MCNTQLLDWDSEILGLRVAKILSTHLDKGKLEQCLQNLKAQGVQLVYWVFASQNSVSHEAAQACRGFFSDEKITYYLDLTTLPALPVPCAEIEIYTALFANAELAALTIEIAQFSRFSRDPRITKQQVDKLYIAWINNACNKLVAKIVLVAKAPRIVGMVTIDDKQGRADLSLLAVDPLHQRTGIGKRLVCAAQAWSLANGYSISQVVTQKTNPKACRLYESCGYHLEKLEYFYHFWL
jgi:dTDP-4-amino-4,6-dideoxy-D-galactose acyltransferase